MTLVTEVLETPNPSAIEDGVTPFMRNSALICSACIIAPVNLLAFVKAVICWLNYGTYKSLLQGVFVSEEKKFISHGKRIAELRGKMSQAAFSEQLGVDRKTVVRWESGERLPDGVSLLALVTEFNADLNYIFTGHSAVGMHADAGEAVLVNAYRAANQQGKTHLIQTAALWAAGLGVANQLASTPTAPTQRASNVGGTVIQAGGSVTNISGEKDESKSSGSRRKRTPSR